MAKEYKELSCREAGADCDFLVRAETEEEVMSIASEHACKIHGYCDVSKMKDEIKSFIKDVSV